ncbi:hypothetical protein CQ14_38390 [Bradyrhizobium lablabi]|uniref:Uncharacterized protein n=1 Tax=Bradyrhizobium lablabi TaxID=722472 RepID=A0A0R3N298_9BRAD|nr:hypothetical protein CQ14_38390 [Bradyrhizobium lablabi]
MIVLPSHASLEVGQRVAKRAKSVTEATGRGDKTFGLALQFALRTMPETTRQVFVLLEAAPLGSSLTPNTQLLFCQLQPIWPPSRNSGASRKPP